MPNRVIRDGFVDSESVCALSDWAHRVYSNLLVKCDDAGRFDGRIEFLRSQLFPLGTPRRNTDFEKALAELAQPKDESGRTLPALVVSYHHAGKPYLQLTKAARSSPCITSRYPWSDGSHKIEYVKLSTRDGDRDFVSTSLSMPSVSHTHGIEGLSAGSPETETETETTKGVGVVAKKPQKKAKEFPTIPAALDSPAFHQAWARWFEHRAEIKHPMTPTAASLALKTLEKMGVSRAVAAIDHSIERGWRGIFEDEKRKQDAEANDPGLNDPTPEDIRRLMEGEDE